MPPKAAPIPSDRELLIQHLMGAIRPPHSVIQTLDESFPFLPTG